MSLIFQLRLLFRWSSLFCLACLLAGCGSFFGGSSSEPTPTATHAVKPVPTFTPTSVPQVQAAAASATMAPTPLPAPAVITPTVAISKSNVLSASQGSPLATTGTLSPTVSRPITPTIAANREAQLVISDAAVNVRSGPATTYDLLGAASQGQSFKVTGKNAAGDWWQICCINNQPGWVFAALAKADNVENVPVIADLPTPAAVAVAPTATLAPEQPTVAPPPPAGPPVDNGNSAGDFNPGAQYQVVSLKVLGLDENNGGIRSSSAQHLILVTVLDENGNGVNGAVVKNLVGDHSEVTTGGKGPGKAEITMYYEPFKLYVASDPSGPVTSQVSNQMGLAFPHLPDIVGKLGGVDYEYAVCPTLEIKCQWPIQAVHFSYEITFQKKK